MCATKRVTFFSLEKNETNKRTKAREVARHDAILIFSKQKKLSRARSNNCGVARKVMCGHIGFWVETETRMVFEFERFEGLKNIGHLIRVQILVWRLRFRDSGSCCSWVQYLRRIRLFSVVNQCVVVPGVPIGGHYGIGSDIFFSCRGDECVVFFWSRKLRISSCKQLKNANRVKADWFHPRIDLESVILR